MTRASRTEDRPASPPVNHPGPETKPATVASLGVQARLVRVDPERERGVRP